MTAVMGDLLRLRLDLTGTVQGVGFRPRAVRLATDRGVTGWVANTLAGVRVELQGGRAAVEAVTSALIASPAPAAVDQVRRRAIPVIAQEADFRIALSRTDGSDAARLSIPPDLAVCDACRREFADPKSHFHHHPFISCVSCGPRWTISDGLPFDRQRSAVASFPLCSACAEAYATPADRRFHAQAFVCPDHPPTLSLLEGAEPATGPAALGAAAAALRAGQILAVKGLGGFQLLTTMDSPPVIAELRRRKQRPHKPLAVMWPSIDALVRDCIVDGAEREALTSSAAPIVLVRPRGPLPVGVTGGRTRVGAMLPPTGLHLALFQAFGGPAVCTSGNRRGEVLASEARDVTGLADVVLDHERPVRRPVDDSVLRFAAGRRILLRRARGLAPTLLPLPESADPQPFLALGAHQKATLALAQQGRAVVGPYLGDLTSRSVVARHAAAADAWGALSGDVAPQLVCDRHPDYASTLLAERLDRHDSSRPSRQTVQHHHAHVAAVAAEHGVALPVLGLAWDGVGLGDDGALWGSEAMIHRGATYDRVAHLRPFRMLGGDATALAPFRSALALLAQLPEATVRPQLVRVEQLIGGASLDTLRRMAASGSRSPWTTSMGRLFDAVAFLAGLPARCSYEAQAAGLLEDAAEQAIHTAEAASPYPLPGGDWRPLVVAVLEDRARGVDAAVIGARFHRALAAWAVQVAAAHPGMPVVCAGGCFQNGLLVQLVAQALEHRAAAFAHALPPNDEAISYGQLVVGAHARATSAGGV